MAMSSDSSSGRLEWVVLAKRSPPSTALRSARARSCGSADALSSPRSRILASPFSMRSCHMEKLSPRRLRARSESLATSRARDPNGHPLPWIRFHAAEPRLVDSRNEFNFVQYMDLVYAIKQSVGPLDVAVEANTLLERFGPDVVVVGQTLEEARAKVDMQLG